MLYFIDEYFSILKLKHIFLIFSFDVYSMSIKINEEDYKIILSDTAGQEEFDKLRKFAYKHVSNLYLSKSYSLEMVIFKN